VTAAELAAAAEERACMEQSLREFYRRAGVDAKAHEEDGTAGWAGTHQLAGRAVLAFLLVAGACGTCLMTGCVEDELSGAYEMARSVGWSADLCHPSGSGVRCADGDASIWCSSTACVDCNEAKVICPGDTKTLEVPSEPLTGETIDVEHAVNLECRGFALIDDRCVVWQNGADRPCTNEERAEARMGIEW
jgi:hypothetical protein